MGYSPWGFKELDRTEATEHGTGILENHASFFSRVIPLGAAMFLSCVDFLFTIN